MKKILITIVATVLVCACVVGGTVAWLMDTSDTVTNTFTVGDIEIKLAETTTEYKIVPGNVIPKDPKVTVLANSEKCYLFVQITESANFRTYMTYGVADGWTAVEDTTGVYYREVDYSTNDQDFYVLKAGTDAAYGCVTVLNTLTADQLEDAETTAPTLSFKAYAVQFANIATAKDAWAVALNNGVPNP